MFAPEADVVLGNGLIEIACEEVIDLTVPQKSARRGMTPFEELPNEGQATLTGLSLDQSNELLAGEVARMRRDNVEETRLVLSVAERTYSDGVHAGDVHSAKISAVISWVSRTRRSLGWSCCRANKWNPAFAFSASP